MDNGLVDFVRKKEQITDIVVRIDAVEEPRPFGEAKIVYLKFMVANEKALRIQCMAMETEIERIRSFVRRNKIIRIRGATSKKEANPKHNDGDVPFILIINPTTVITLIKDCASDDEDEDKVERNFVTDSSNSSFGTLITRCDLDHVITVINKNIIAMRELVEVLREGRANFSNQ